MTADERPTNGPEAAIVGGHPPTSGRLAFAPMIVVRTEGQDRLWPTAHWRTAVVVVDLHKRRRRTGRHHVHHAHQGEPVQLGVTEDLGRGASSMAGLTTLTLCRTTFRQLPRVVEVIRLGRLFGRIALFCGVDKCLRACG